MAKSLGQIHTTHFNYEVPETAIGAGDAFLCDGSAELSKQFNRNIRMMSIYKLVGADLVVQLPDQAALGPTTSAVVKGRLRYFQPTKGRCNALRDAYQQFRTMAKAQGVDPSKNKLFDFRVIPRPLTEYPANVPPFSDQEIFNTSTFDGTNPLVMRGGGAGHTVFTSYNEGIRPRDGSVVAGDFASGLDTWQSGTQTDFVLNEGTIQSGNPLYADEEMEQIPFELAFDIVAGQYRADTLQWRPDPALYIGILGGFVEVILDEVAAEGTGPIDGVEMDVSLHWAGWKSIVREPKSRRMTSSRKHSSPGKKNHSKKK